MALGDQPTPSLGVADTYEAEHFSDRASEEYLQHSVPEESNPKASGFRASTGLHNVARRTLGIILLLITVILWTVSNFLASVSGSDRLQRLCRLIAFSISSPITHIQNHTLSHTSTQHFLQFR